MIYLCFLKGADSAVVQKTGELYIQQLSKFA